MEKTEYITIWIDREFFPKMSDLINHVSSKLRDRLAAYPERRNKKWRQVGLESYISGKYVVYGVRYLNHTLNCGVEGYSA